MKKKSDIKIKDTRKGIINKNDTDKDKNNKDNKKGSDMDKGKKNSKDTNKLSSKIKNYHELQDEYELTPDHQTPRAVLRRIGENLEGYIKILIQILQPEEYYSLHECNSFDDEEKAKIMDIYKSLMILHRELLRVEINNDEKETMKTIQDVHESMKTVKKQIIVIVQKLQDSWKNDSIKSRMRYVG
jgi:hypothetical protein